jgi:hypothetical protein
MDDNKTIEMLRLNPNQDPGDKTLKQNLLPPIETDLENLFQTSDLKMYLGISATTDKGMNAVAKKKGWSMSGGTQLKNQRKTIVLKNITSYWF